MKELRKKSFEVLMGGIGYKEPQDIPEDQEFPDYPEVSDEEVDIRAQVFLNGYRVVEESTRKKINDISFQLNQKFAKGCQAGELIESYNEMIGQFQDDFIF